MAVLKPSAQLNGGWPGIKKCFALEPMKTETEINSKILIKKLRAESSNFKAPIKFFLVINCQHGKCSGFCLWYICNLSGLD